MFRGRDPRQEPSGVGLWLREDSGVLTEVLPHHGWGEYYGIFGVLADGVAVRAPSPSGLDGLFRVSTAQSVELVVSDPYLDEATGIELSPAGTLADGHRVAFVGEPLLPVFGTYVRIQERDRSIQPVVDTGDVLEGLTVLYAGAVPAALDGDALALTILRTGDQGADDLAVWVADLDLNGEPVTSIPALDGVGASAFALVLIAVAVAALSRLRGSTRLV